MDLYEAIKKRRVIREWADKNVDYAEIKRILEAGLSAPSNNHLREWDFIVLHSAAEKENALKFVKEWVRKYNETLSSVAAVTPAQKMYRYAEPRQYSMLADAPYVIIPVFRARNDIFRATAINHLNSFASIWCVIENMFLAATAEGLACSMRIPVESEGKDLAAELNVPDGWFIPCYIGVGYPSNNAEELEQTFYFAEEKIHIGKW